VIWSYSYLIEPIFVTMRSEAVRDPFRMIGKRVVNDVQAWFRHPEIAVNQTDRLDYST
jgi:hypothetical protein